MDDAKRALYERIQAFSVDHGAEALTFVQRLARENGWTIEYAQRVLEEYKRFMFLAVASGHPVTPSDQVDQAWHLHLAYTRSYWLEWCPNVLGQQVHHGPTKGGADENRKFHDWYQKTLSSYRAMLGEEPPADIWPEASVRFGDDTHHQRVNTKRNWVVRKPARMGRPTRIAAAFSPVLIGGPALAAQDAPLWLRLVGGLLIAVVIYWLIKLAIRGGGRGGGSGCSTFFGGCGGGGCSADSGCGAGCGGGCGS